MFFLCSALYMVPNDTTAEEPPSLSLVVLIAPFAAAALVGSIEGNRICFGSRFRADGSMSVFCARVVMSRRAALLKPAS